MHETYDGQLHFDICPQLGIIGGGQLARMTSIAAHQLGCDVVSLENNRLSPAATFASQTYAALGPDPESVWS